MVAEHDNTEISVGAERFGAPAAQMTKDSTAGELLRDSAWQMAMTGLSFQSPLGELPNRLSTLGEADLSKEGKFPVVPQASDTSKRFGLPSQFVEKTQAFSDATSETKLAGPTIEQRQKSVEQLEQLMKEQYYRSNLQLAGVGTVMAGLAIAVRASTPAGLAITALGLGTSIYNNTKADGAHESAGNILKQMPKVDSERFGKYERDIRNAESISARGYIMGGGIALISMSQVTKYINRNTSGLTLFASLGNNLYQTHYSMPKTLSDFRSEVENWNQDLKKK